MQRDATRLGWCLFVAAILLLTLTLAVYKAAAPEAAEVLAEKQELRLPLSGEPQFLDPNRVFFATDVSMVKQLFRGLLWFDEQLQVVPMAALEVPSVDNGGIAKDGLTYRFKLRDGLKWSDGRPLTATDFAYSVKRLLDPAVAAEYASFYYDIKGAQEFNTTRETTPAIIERLRAAVGVHAPDDKTLVFTLKTPRPTFLQLMALWPVFPLRQDVIEKHGEKWTEAGNLVGNGPFVLKEWVHQDRVILEPNPNWWGADKPKLTKVTCRIITDRVQAYNAYLARELDYVDIPPEQKEAVDRDPGLSKENVQHTMLLTSAHQFNHTRPPFDNVQVRQAFSLAFDREAFVKVVFKGIGRVAYSWIPPGMPGHDATLGRQWQFDPAQAKRMLAQAGYPGGKGLRKIAFTFAQTGVNPLIAQFTQEQLKRHLGVDLDLDPVESKVFQDRIARHDFQLSLLGWGADYPDPDNWLPELWGCKQYEAGKCTQYAGNNHALYANPEFDRLMDQAARELDAQKRLELYARGQKLIVDEAAVIFTTHRARNLLIRPYVRDLIRTGLDGGVVGDSALERTFIAKR